MQALKVMITSVLVLAACTEGLPEGKSCVLKYVKLFHILYMAVTAGCSIITNCSVLTSLMDKSFSSSLRQK